MGFAIVGSGRCLISIFSTIILAADAAASARSTFFHFPAQDNHDHDDHYFDNSHDDDDHYEGHSDIF